MDDTLGFVGAAAAVVSHRRDGALRRRCETIDEAGHGDLGLEELSRARAQQRAVEVEHRDIANGCSRQILRRVVRALY